MHVGTVAAGRIGLAVLKRLHAFECKLHYCDRHRLPKEVEERYNLTHWSDWKDMVKQMECAAIASHARPPFHERLLASALRYHSTHVVRPLVLNLPHALAPHPLPV
jgi:formate dehydrogenase